MCAFQPTLIKSTHQRSDFSITTKEECDHILRRPLFTDIRHH